MRPALLLALVPAFALIGSPASAQRDAVCFFEHVNFGGQRECFSIGQRVNLVRMNDNYSSVQIPAGVRVTMCEHEKFGGRCIPLDRSVASFVDLKFNDIVSSVAVEAIQTGRGPGEPRDRYDDRDRDRGRGRDMGPPPRGGGPPSRYSDARAEMRELRMDCEDGDRRACIRFGILIGRNWERRERWREESPEFFGWERR
jgi:hypothetical protein